MTTPRPVAPAPNVATIDPVAWLESLLPSGRPRRMAQMYASGPAKYRDFPKDEDPPASWLHDHIAGISTWAATLDKNGLARLGIVDIDRDTPAAGRAALMDAYLRVRDAGLQAFAIYVENAENGHYGGHILVVYSDFVSAAAITAQLHQILPDVAEIWPCNQVIRLPFGYHQRARSYGELWYTAAGEFQHYDMNNPRRRSAAIELVMGLPTNAAPDCPPLISKPAPPKLPTRKITLGEQAAEHMALTERYALARAYILDNYDLVSALESAGAVQTRSGYSCPFHGHSHETTLTIADDGRVGYSHSPNCVGLYGERGFDVTNVLILAGAYVNFDKLARALAPHCFPQPKPKAQQRQAPDYLTTAERERRHKDAERKRAARKQAAADLRADVMGRAAVDADMPEQTRVLLDIHLAIAGDRGWHRASVARMAELAGYGERWVQRFNAYLLDNGYLSRQDTSGSTTAIWTFERGSRSPVETSAVAPIAVENCDRSPVLDLDRDSLWEPVVAYEGGGELDAWEACDAPHSAAELSALDAAERWDDAAIDWADIEQRLAEMTPEQINAAVEQERHDPERLWTRGEAMTWHADADRRTPDAKKADQKTSRQKDEARERARWSAMVAAGEWGKLRGELQKLRNTVKKRPDTSAWAGWRIRELAAIVAQEPVPEPVRRLPLPLPPIAPPHKQNSVVTPVAPVVMPNVALVVTPDVTPDVTPHATAHATAHATGCATDYDAAATIAALYRRLGRNDDAARLQPAHFVSIC